MNLSFTLFAVARSSIRGVFAVVRFSTLQPSALVQTAAPTLLLAGSWERLQPRMLKITTNIEFMGQQ